MSLCDFCESYIKCDAFFQYIFMDKDTNLFIPQMQVRGALETLVSALTPIDHAKGPKNEIQPAIMNTDLLSREADSISLLLSLLVRIL